MTGPISKDIATGRYFHVIRGMVAKRHALHWGRIFPVSTARKKMCTSKVYTEENIHGWASLISTLKGHLCGAMEHFLTFITGRNINQTTSTMKTVFTHLGSFKITSINGTISTAQTATDSPARKVTYVSIVKTAIFMD